MKKVLPKRLAVAALVAAAAGGWYWYSVRSGNDEVRYRLAKLERGPIASVVVASGTVNAVTTVQVGSQLSGQIKDIYADFNTPVKRDQVIARLDPATFELRVNQARADLDSTREQLKSMEAQIQVNDAQVASARAAVKQRESLLRQAQVELERTVIRAPVDGTVILRNINAGQTVAASLQAPVLFTIAEDLRDLQVEAAIDEADVGRLRSGMAASFAVDAFPRRGFTGEIRQIRKSPQNVQNVVSYTVVISAANPDLALLPGMTANVRIVVDSRPSVLKAPNAALRWRPAGTGDGKPAAAGRVWVLEAGRPTAVPVKLGLSDGTSTELAQSPFAEGAQVIVGISDSRAQKSEASGGPPRGRFF